LLHVEGDQKDTVDLTREDEWAEKSEDSEEAIWTPTANCTET